MRSRFFAILILVLFLVIPGYLFWHFFREEKSSLIFIAPPDFPFHISLSGKFGFRYFPLFDRVFSYESDCVGSCIFSPLPPLHYDGQIRSSNHMTEDFSLSIPLGKEVRHSVDLAPLLSFERIGSLVGDDEVLIAATLQDGRKSFSGVFSPLGQSQSGTVVVFENQASRSLVGELGNEGFVPYFSLPFVLSGGSIDISKSAYILENTASEKILVSLDGKTRIPYTLAFNPRSIMLTPMPMVSTENSDYSYEDGIWRENPRFTHFIDIDESTRIGYIDKNDFAKRDLSNISLPLSLLFLLDRKTGQSHIIYKNLDIDSFIMHEGMPGFIQKDGTISLITNVSTLTSLTD